MINSRYVPYDLSSEEDRKILRGKWVKCDGNEYPIEAIGDKSVRVNKTWIPPGYLLRVYTDVETGEPCGKLVTHT